MLQRPLHHMFQFGYPSVEHFMKQNAECLPMMCTGTCILFGDGCGAVVLQSQEGPCGLLGHKMQSDGSGQKNLHCLFQASIVI